MATVGEERTGTRERASAWGTSIVRALFHPATFSRVERGPDGRVSDLQIVEVNEAATSLMRLRREDLVGRSHIPPRMNRGFVARYLALVQGAVDDQRPQAAVERIEDLFRPGSMLVDMRIVPQGEFVVTVGREVRAPTGDVTEAALEVVLANLDDVVVSMSPAEQRTVFISPAIERLTGGRMADLLGPWDRLAAVFHPDDRERLCALFFEALERGSASGHARIMRRDGGVRHVQVRAFGSRDEAGRPTRVDGIYTDVTGPRELEQALERSEAHYRSVVEAQSDLIGRFRPDGLVTFANQAARDYVGMGASPPTQLPFRDMIPPDDYRRFGEAMRSLSPANPRVEMDQRLRGKDGTLRWFNWTNEAFFDDAGELVEIQGVGRDVTERRQELEQLERALDHSRVLVAELSHRAKNSLQLVTSLVRSQLREGGTPEQLAERCRHVAEQIEAMGVVHQTLYGAMRGSRLDAAAFLERLVESLRSSVPRDEITITAELAPLPLTLDQGLHCGLLVYELVTNAIKHAFPGRERGSIAIRLAEAASGRAELEVADDGVGLPPGAEAGRATSYGMLLLQQLSAYLRGDLTIDRAGGTRVRIAFALRDHA